MGGEVFGAQPVAVAGQGRHDLLDPALDVPLPHPTVLESGLAGLRSRTARSRGPLGHQREGSGAGRRSAATGASRSGTRWAPPRGERQSGTRGWEGLHVQDRPAAARRTGECGSMRGSPCRQRTGSAPTMGFLRRLPAMRGSTGPAPRHPRSMPFAQPAAGGSSSTKPRQARTHATARRPAGPAPPRRHRVRLAAGPRFARPAGSVAAGSIGVRNGVGCRTLGPQP